jgi:hypothetical protein
MGFLLIICPVTGKEFSTGVQVDEDSLKTLRDIEATARCPHCHADHSWNPIEARYIEALPPKDWAENQSK